MVSKPDWEHATSYFPEFVEPVVPNAHANEQADLVPKADPRSFRFWATVAVLFSLGYAVGKCTAESVVPGVQ